MAQDKSNANSTRSDQDDILRYDYHLSTLYEISRDLFGELDIEVILRNFLLSTMGIVGASEGFVMIADPRSRKVRSLVMGGYCEVDNKVLQERALAAMLDEVIAEPIEVGETAGRFDFLTQPAGCLLKFQIDGGNIGLMVLGAKLIGEPYAPEECKLLVTLKNNMVVALRNARSFEIINRLNQDLLKKKAQLEETVEELQVAKADVEQYSKHLEQIIAALNVAQEVQQSLLPRHPPKQESVDITGTSLYCDETGGDYFDFIPLPQIGLGIWALVVGDVSGHGISSALLMAGVRAYLRSRVIQPGAASDIIGDVNRMVSADTVQTAQFMTLIFLVVDADRKCLTWVNAGHEPAMVYDPGRDEFSELGGRDIPLGVEAGWEFQTHETVAEAGQVVVLTTDGVWEVRNQEGEMFGKQRLLEVIRNHASMDAAGIRAAIVSTVTGFLGDSAQEDDITLVVCKFV